MSYTDEEAKQIIFLNSSGDPEANYKYFKKENKRMTSKINDAQPIEMIKRVIASGQPITSTYRVKAIQTINDKAKPNQKDELLRDIDKSKIDNEVYKNFQFKIKNEELKNLAATINRNLSIPKLVEVPKPTPEVLPPAVSAEEELAKIQVALNKTTIADIEAKAAKDASEAASGLHSSTPTVIVPVIPEPYASVLGAYTSTLNDLFGKADYSAEEQEVIYKDLAANPDRIPSFITDPKNYLLPTITTTTSPVIPPLIPTPAIIPTPATPTTTPIITTPVAATSPTPPTVPDPIDKNPVVPVQMSDKLQATSREGIEFKTESGKDRYHPIELMWFFGSSSNPAWDTILEKQILYSKLEKSVIIEKMNMYLEEFGKRMGIKTKKSDTIEEYNEIAQMAFCIMRNLQRGDRYKTANIKLSDLQQLTSITAPAIPTTTPGSAPVIPVNQEPIIMTKPEAEANFQRVFNNLKTDLAGRSTASIGKINRVRTIYSGNTDNDLFRPNNYINRKII